ncbi:KH domain-containing protein, partial [Paenibacillus xylanexedens]|uniref:KH domain-containing protein n=1 Tax=Paenibacillus xylanexedens TaxID=528191 RepID=UPI00119F3F63
ELVSVIGKGLVDDAEDVRVGRVEKEGVVVYELRVDGEDVGKVIGKEGGIGKCLGTVVTSGGVKMDKGVRVDTTC